MKHVALAGTVALLMAAAPAFAQQANPPAHPDKQAHPEKQMGAAGSDQQFVMNVAKDGMAEVEIGKVVAEKASSADVKKFAQRMVDDHSKANDELKTIAQSKNITLPSSLDPQHKMKLDKLSKMSGEALDRAYMQDMVRDHQKAVAAFKTESKSGKDPEIKAFAAKTLPTLEEHLKSAQDTSRSVVGTSGKK